MSFGKHLHLIVLIACLISGTSCTRPEPRMHIQIQGTVWLRDTRTPLTGFTVMLRTVSSKGFNKRYTTHAETMNDSLGFYELSIKWACSEDLLITARKLGWNHYYKSPECTDEIQTIDFHMYPRTTF